MFDQTKLSSRGRDFIDESKIGDLLKIKTSPSGVREVIAKSMEKKPLSLEETATLLAADSPDLIEEIYEAARQLKRDVYGNRIVLFAPLYIGNYCQNDCSYCGFRSSNLNAVRCTLSQDELRQQVEALENCGHKRLILVFGEHPTYTPDFIADCVRKCYEVKVGKGDIRRVNINAAPMDHEGFEKVKAAGIGTYQIFQETYHHETYRKVHPAGTSKGNYLWRLDGLSRAYEAKCDDVGIGALLGLYDWRFETLGLVAHSIHLEKTFGVGPHTLSFPRLRPASGVSIDPQWQVSDEDFKRLIAILRLSVPYAGMILTAREPAELRREILAFGVSQIDAGTKIELGGYTEKKDEQELNREQFHIGDSRGLDEVMRDLLEDNYIPSFCTACYRLGRTGEQFMEFAVPGWIQDFCTPNALATLTEYLMDYSSEETRKAGRAAIEREMASFPDGAIKEQLKARIKQIETTDTRDLYF